MPEALIVDSDIKIVETLTNVLENIGLDISVAENPEKAFDKLKYSKPKLVISEVLFNGKKEGYEFCKKLKAQFNFKNTNFVFISEQPITEDNGEHARVGADHYFQKPVITEKLIFFLSNLITISQKAEPTQFAITQKIDTKTLNEVSKILIEKKRNKLKTNNKIQVKPVRLGKSLNLKKVALNKWFLGYKNLYSKNLGATPNSMIFDGSKLWIATKNPNQLIAVDPNEFCIIGRINLYSEPDHIIFDGVYLWVACSKTLKIYRASPVEYNLLEEITTKDHINKLGYDGESLYLISTKKGELTKISINKRKILWRNKVGNTPKGFLFDGEFIWITCRSDSTLVKVDHITGKRIKSIKVGIDPQSISFDGEFLYIADHSSNIIFKMDRNELFCHYAFEVGGKPSSLQFDGEYLWVSLKAENKVIVLDIINNKIISKIDVGESPNNLAFDGANIWVSNINSKDLNKL